MNPKRKVAIAAGLIGLLFLPCFRPPRESSDVSVLRSSAKGPRKSPTELPETKLSRLQNGDSTVFLDERFRDVDARQARGTGSLAFVSPTVRAKLLEGRARPRYLQSGNAPEPHSTPAPPSA